MSAAQYYYHEYPEASLIKCQSNGAKYYDVTAWMKAGEERPPVTYADQPPKPEKKTDILGAILGAAAAIK